MSAQKILDLLVSVFLNVDLKYPFLAFTSLLACFGMYGIFRKCGLKGWYHSLPPGNLAGQGSRP